MNFPINSPYPVYAFPATLRDLILELQDNTQAPAELIGPAVLGMASLTCQNSIAVRRPNCAPSSCSLYLLTIANSGEGKSTVSNILLAPILEFEKNSAEKNKSKLIKLQADEVAWNIAYKAIVLEIEKLTKTGSSVDAAKFRLEQLLSKRPKRFITPRLIYDNVTSEAVVFGLCEGWQSAAIIADEGGNFFNGRASTDIATWTKLWDGSALTVDRRGAGKISSQAPRCCLVLSIQDAPFRRFLSRIGTEALETGFLPRFLVSYPAPTRGTRFISDKPKFWSATEKYGERVKQILQANAEDIENGNNDHNVLEFSSEAKLRWINAFNNIEREAAPGNCLSEIQGYAAKAADNIARIAAIFHFFEGGVGEISVNTVEQAIAICQWHACEFRRLFSPQQKIPMEFQDAQLLEGWLYGHITKTGNTWVYKNYVLQYGPNSLRNKNRLGCALEILKAQGKIIYGLDNRRARFITPTSVFYVGKNG
jgi:hypothetical protein